MTAALPSLTKLKPNPRWARLPLFDRKGWRTVRFGEVVRMLKEQTDPVADGVNAGSSRITSSALLASLC
jgi:hypothetical protein